MRNTDTTAATRTRSLKTAARAAELQEVIAELVADAGYELTLQQVADALNAAGYTTTRGKPFSRVQEHRIKRAAT